MGSLATTDLDDLYDLYFPFIAAMTYSGSATVLAIWQQEATVSLKAWYSARKALLNIEQSAASNYSSGVGSSFQKRQADEAAAKVSKHYAAFVAKCLQGGQTIPSDAPSASYWDLRGVTNDSERT